MKKIRKNKMKWKRERKKLQSRIQWIMLRWNWMNEWMKEEWKKNEKKNNLVNNA